MHRYISLILFVGLGTYSHGAITPYISPGIQIGYNTDRGKYIGFQISLGMSYNSKSNHFYSPSVCSGYKRFFLSKIKETYMDIQISSVPDTRFAVEGLLVPLGFGVGMNYTNGSSSMRIKGWTWLFSCITYDYEIKTQSKNISLIPILPIGDF